MGKLQFSGVAISGLPSVYPKIVIEYFYVTMQQLSRVFSDTEKISQLENLKPIRQSRQLQHQYFH